MHQGSVLAGRYRLEQRIGSGGMGEVWRATDQQLGRVVAVKVMLPSLVSEPGFVDRFRAEARTMASIQHPGVVTLHDYLDDPAGALLIMDYVAGEPLSQLLARVGRLPAARTMELVAQAADALHAAHRTGVIHRDVKPANLLLREDGPVVLTDFGIARVDTGLQLTATGQVLGTPSYLAPEQVMGGAATPRTDIYALGVLAYECLTGRRPFDRDNPFAAAMARIREEPPTMAADVPPAVAAVVERALRPEESHRWQSAAELAAACRQAAATPAVPAGAAAPALPAAPYPYAPAPPAPGPPPSPASPASPATMLSHPYGGAPPPRPRRAPTAVLAVALTLLVVAGAAVGWTVLREGDVDGTVEAQGGAGAATPGSPPVPVTELRFQDAVMNVPQGWREESRTDIRVDLQDPAEPLGLIRMLAEPSSVDSLAFVEIAEVNIADNCPDPYQRVGISEIQVAGQSATQLEYLCGTGEQLRRTRWVTLVRDGTAYSFLLRLPEHQFEQRRGIFDEMVRSFRVAGPGQS